MILGDKHIAFLNEVHKGNIKLWWNPPRTIAKYVHKDWNGNGYKSVDQMVAAQVRALGLTHVVNRDSQNWIELTVKGEFVLIEEDEAWA